jgi:thioredoxin-related protein
MYRSDKTIFNAAELPKTRPVVLIYFDPDCDHCQKLMKELFQKIDAFKKAEIIMVTFKSVEEVAAFEKQHNTQKYPNIIAGTEGIGFYLRNYYGLMTIPFTALYDKKGNLNYSYRKETFVDDLINRLRNL